MAKARDGRAAGAASGADVRLVVSGSEANAAIAKQIAAGEELLRGVPPDATAFQALVEKKRIWHDFNVDLLGRLFSTTDEAEKYRRTPTNGSLAPGQSISDRTHTLHNTVRSYITSLRSLQNRLPLFLEAGKTTGPGPGDSGSPASLGRMVASSRLEHGTVAQNEVFVVNGHDDSWKHLESLLYRIGAKPVVFPSIPKKGSETVIEILARTLPTTEAVVVLMTPDDEGRKRGTADPLVPRARENVLIEAGCAVVNRRDRTLIIAMGGVNIPSDFDGIHRVQAESWTNEVEGQVARRLHDMGLKLDVAKAIRG